MSKMNYYRIMKENNNFIQYLKNLECEEIPEITKESDGSAKNESDVLKIHKIATEVEDANTLATRKKLFQILRVLVVMLLKL